MMLRLRARNLEDWLEDHGMIKGSEIRTVLRASGMAIANVYTLNFTIYSSSKDFKFANWTRFGIICRTPDYRKAPIMFLCCKSLFLENNILSIVK